MTTDESAQTDVLLCDLGVFVQGIPPKHSDFEYDNEIQVDLKGIVPVRKICQLTKQSSCLKIGEGEERESRQV